MLEKQSGYLDIHCADCLEIVCVKDNTLLECGHLFDKACIGNEYTCIVDKEPIASRIDEAGTQRLAELRMKCMYCGLSVDLVDFENHVYTNCRSSLFACAKRGEGCDYCALLPAVQKHMSSCLHVQFGEMLQSSLQDQKAEFESVIESITVQKDQDVSHLLGKIAMLERNLVLLEQQFVATTEEVNHGKLPIPKPISPRAVSPPYGQVEVSNGPKYLHIRWHDTSEATGLVLPEASIALMRGLQSGAVEIDLTSGKRIRLQRGSFTAVWKNSGAILQWSLADPPEEDLLSPKGDSLGFVSFAS
jgi:hypothetical protein